MAAPSVLRHWVRALVPQLLCLISTVGMLGLLQKMALGLQTLTALLTQQAEILSTWQCVSPRADWGVCVYESLPPLLPGGQTLWFYSCGINYGTWQIRLKLGLCLNSPSPVALFPLSWFLHSFTVSPGSFSWIKEELNKLLSQVLLLENPA